MKELQRILHVEDEADIRAVAKMALEKVGGFIVKSCASGEEALKEAETFGPDLLLLDVMMPGMDGPATLKALWEKPSLADVRAIFMTAKVQPAEVDQFKSMGVDAIIAKPFDPMTLAEQLSAIWNGK